MSLPELVVFSVSDSTNEVRYLSFTGPQRQLRFGPVEDVFSDIARFTVISAGDGLVHIRSCYDNYYWARGSRTEPWLVASSPEKVEDMSKDECTLLRPRLTAGNVFVEFVHAQSGLNVVMRPPTDAHAYNLCLEHGVPTQFSYTDFAALSRMKLPRFVMFLGDDNRNQLSTSNINVNSAVLSFREFRLSQSREFGFEIFYNKSGDKLRFKSMSLNDFWCVIPPETTVSINPRSELNPDTMLFDAIRPSVGIALRSLVNNKYCHRIQQNNNQAFLVAGSNSPHDRNASLQPMNLGYSDLRRVNIESFRHALRGPKSSRVLTVLVLGNNTNDVMEWDEPVQYGKLMYHTYSNSTSFVGQSALFTVRVPNIDSTGELEFPNAATQFTTTWGVRDSVWHFTKEDIPMKIPPMTTVTATLTFDRAAYELPFSYEQIEVFPWNDTETQYFHDGVFKTDSDYGSPFFSYEYRPFNPEEFDGTLRKVLRAMEIEGNTAQDDGVEVEVEVEPKASHDQANQE